MPGILQKALDEMVKGMRENGESSKISKLLSLGNKGKSSAAKIEEIAKCRQNNREFGDTVQTKGLTFPFQITFVIFFIQVFTGFVCVTKFNNKSKYY